MRDAAGRFKSWPGGEHDPGSYRRFKRSLDERGKRQVTTKAGTVWRKNSDGEWRKVKDSKGRPVRKTKRP